MKLNLIGPQQKGVSVAVNNQLTQNCYPILTPGGRNPVALIGSPGSSLFSSVSGACRGVHVLGGTLYGVFGTTLYSASQAGNVSSIGTVTGSGRVDMADDGTNLVIVTGYGSTGYVYNGSLAAITDPDFPGAETVEYTGGYFVFHSTGDGWFISEVNSATSYNALDVAANDGEPIQVIREDHREIFVFGTENTRVWINTGNSDFAFERNNSVEIERGTYARWSVARDDNTLFFLGDDLVVYRMEGYTPVRVSDEGTEAELTQYLTDGYETDLKASYAYSYTDHGHKFYVLTVPNRGTHVFDVGMNAWHSRKHWDYETHHSFDYAFCYGKHLVGGIDGNVYEMSRSYHDDAGEILKRIRRSQVFGDDRRLRWKKIKLVMNVGNGLTTGQGSDPEVVIRWSNDHGRTWSNERQLGIGVSGDYTKTVATRNCGSSRNRIIEIYQTDPVPFELIDAYAVVA